MQKVSLLILMAAVDWAAALSIIDLSGGRQPLSSDDNRIHAVVNGEIYNFQELRKALIRDGYRFRPIPIRKSFYMHMRSGALLLLKRLTECSRSLCGTPRRIL